MAYQSVLDFWFEEIKPEMQWKKDAAFDQEIRDRFGRLHEAAKNCELFTWRKHPEGRLAEIILLDQFSRNMFRDLPEAFACDSLALVLAQEAVASGSDQQIPIARRSFLYMPYMHSESKVIHQIAVDLFSQPGLEGSLNFEKKHKAIIDRFGRYPHRNKILGRLSTEEEQTFLLEPNSSF